MSQFLQGKFNRRALVSAVSAVALSLSLMGLSGCGSSSDDDGPSGTEYGASRSLGNGSARAFITRSNGVPEKVGVEFTEETRNGLPTFNPTASGDALETLLPLPAGTNTDTAFEGLSLFWSPGHPPAGNQDVPHWHLDAYTINQSDRMALSPGLTWDPTVAPAKVPAGHINIFVFVPQQGYIYIDPTIEMFAGHPFSTTGYAFYYAKGEMTTMEISAADSFLVSKQNSEFAIPQPTTYPKPGYYPTHGSITYDATTKVYTFTMDQFVKR